MADSIGCCIAGGGPAGAVLALLLARRGVPTTLLEAHEDFDRAFRGDTVHPSTLEMLDDLGLADPLLTRDHARLHRMTLQSDEVTVVLADFTRLRSRFPFIAMIPQAEFLDFIVGEAGKHDCFDLRLGARVSELIMEGGAVRGVRYRDRGGDREIRAALTVAADGRASRLRKLAGFVPRRNAATMDVMWLVLPRRDDERAVDMSGFRIGRGRLVVVLARAHQWQLGYTVLKGNNRAVREAGLEALRSELAGLLPEFADRMDVIRDWQDVHFLSVESSRIPTWHREGLLAIGDAAHVMSPIGGVGINYAVQDAVAAANLLAEPLLRGDLTDAHLAAVQRRREFPTRFIQFVQGVVQRRLGREHWRTSRSDCRGRSGSPRLCRCSEISPDGWSAGASDPSACVRPRSAASPRPPAGRSDKQRVSGPRTGVATPGTRRGDYCSLRTYLTSCRGPTSAP